MTDTDPKSEQKDLTGGKILDDRSCTDWLVTIFWFLFMAGWTAIIIFAGVNGDLSRVLLASNFRGELCGEGRLSGFSLSFVPLPTQVLYSLCVPQCPSPLDYVCNNDLEPRVNDSVVAPNTIYNLRRSEYLRGLGLAASCPVRACTQEEQDLVAAVVGLAVRLREGKCFPVTYSSSELLNRCLPSQLVSQNATVLSLFNESTQLLNDFARELNIGTFFAIGMEELELAWPVLLICLGAALILTLLWLFLIRYCLAPFVYLSLLAMLGLFIALGVLFFVRGNEAESLNLPGAQGLDSQVTIWRIMQFTSWILAGIFLVAVIFLLDRIRIAISILTEASRAFLDNLGLIFVPFIVVIFLLAYTGLFVMTALFITTLVVPQSIAIDFVPAAVLGEVSLSESQLAGNGIAERVIEQYNSSIVNVNINISTIESDTVLLGLQAYNFFGFLWGAASCIFYGYFVVAMVCVVWYFSATAIEIDQSDRGVGGRQKQAPRLTIIRSMWIAFRYHLGTILFGALLIALIQFIRVVVLYLERKFLKPWKQNATVRCALCCLNCCLACIERLIRIISENAFIVCCIKDINFCRSAALAVKLLVANVLRMGTVSVISTIVIVIMKLIIVGLNVVLCWILIRVPVLTNNTEIRSGLFPIMAVLVFTYLIAALFLSVYEYCVDAVLMSFFVDEDEFNGQYLPPNLAKLLNKFRDVEAARKSYKDRLEKVDENA